MHAHESSPKTQRTSVTGAPARPSRTSLTSPYVVQHAACACGGGCPRCRNTLPLQSKLAVSEPGDAHEREAERTADRVMGMRARSEDDDAQLEDGMPLVSRDVAGLASPAVHDAPPIVGEALRSPGQALDARARTFMELRFGHDFSGVHVHTDSLAAESAQALSALAYTTGNHIVFRGGHYQPSSERGQHLIAHELTHVVQQRGQTGAARAQVSRATESFDQAKQRVIEELNRNMPVAILTMLDTMDAKNREQLADDAEVLSAIARLPAGAQGIVKRHLTPVAPAAAAAAQKRPAELIPVAISSGYADFGLHPDRANQAVTIFGQTDLANDLMAWFAKKNIKVSVVFVARRSEFPGGKGEGAAADGTYEDTTAYVAGSNLLYQDGAWTDQASDRNPEAMAKTVFHELLHIWFVKGRALPESDPLHTGHSAEVKAPDTRASGVTDYDEAGYDPRFLAKLKEFDAEVAARKNAAANAQSP